MRGSVLLTVAREGEVLVIEQVVLMRELNSS